MKNFYLALFLLFSSICYSQSTCPGLDSINYSGQWYHSVQIGSQCWLKENLNVGTMLQAVADQPNDSLIEKFCYNNDPAMCDIYGGLYQWREAMQYTMKERARGICPVGWHIPSGSDFLSLLSNVNRDGNALKMVGQGEGTNTSGFSALLTGINDYTSFSNLGINANLWTSNGVPSIYSYMNLIGGNMTIENNSGVSLYLIYYAYSGLSVRCLRDTLGLLLQAPYGGESWQVGSSHKISWGGDLVDKKIKIEYTTDNGINWIEIIGFTPAIDGEYNWTIPNTPSKNCRVRISDVSIPDTFSLSDNVFTILNNPCPSGSMVKHGGKTYNTIAIGSKCWFKENVDIGTMIPGSSHPVNNGIIEKYCYNDDTANCNIYGGLYTNSEAGEEGFCPTFWHTEGIGNVIKNTIYDGNAIKAVGQGSGFGAGTNMSGFSALLAGYRDGNGIFHNLGTEACFPSWLLNPTMPPYVDCNFIYSNNGYINEDDSWALNMGSSYRCYRDEVGPLMLKSPAGGESWQVGSTQKITWTLSNVINISIDYTTNNGSNWINIVSSTPTSTGSYNWTIPNTLSTNCKVRIISVNNPDTNSVSGNVFRIYQVPTNPCPGIPTVDYGGQTYNTIAIGDQCWMRENLNIGTLINVTQDQSNNGIIEKYCCNNDSTKCSIYGGLYQWDEAMQYTTKEGEKGICPTGWHIPTWNEYVTLETFVGGNGNELKEVGQGSGKGVGTNTSGFSALLAGKSYQGTFSFLGNDAFNWSSRVYDASTAYYIVLVGNDITILGGPDSYNVGASIRCIYDLKVSELPVELISFTATVIDKNVKLNWNTATEINSYSFEIEKKLSSNNKWETITEVKASGNSTKPMQYFHIDKNINSGTYNYRLKMIDLDGSFKYSKIVTAEIVAPLIFELANAYPNPWNPTTTIRYQVPKNIFVTIKVFNSLGREIATLVNELKPTGRYEVTFSGKNLSSGIYYYQMKAGNFFETKKFILMK